MPLRKIYDDWSKPNIQPCVSPEHDPPSMMSLPPGKYEWTCPVCGKKQVFVVDGLYM